MRFGQDRDARFTPYREELEPLLVDRQVDERDVDAAVVQHVDLVVPVDAVQVDVGLRAGGSEAAQRVGERVADEEADGQRRSPAGGALQAPAGGVGRGEQRPRLLEQLLAGRSQRDAPGRAGEQVRAELLLELADLPAEHRLRDVEALRRAPEVQLFGDRDEVAQLAQVQRWAGPGIHARRVSMARKRC